MQKKIISFSSGLVVSKKISINPLNFEKLPKKLDTNSNHNSNVFLNLTRNHSNKTKDNLSSCSSIKPKPKVYFVGPLSSRTTNLNNQNPIKVDDLPKTAITNINVISCQKMRQISRNKPFNKLLAHSLYVSYNNSSNSHRNQTNSNSSNKNACNKNGKNNHYLTSCNNKSGNYNMNLTSKNNTYNKSSVSKSSSRNESCRRTHNNNSTNSFLINSKDSNNATLSALDKMKQKTNMSSNTNISNANNNYNSNSINNNNNNNKKTHDKDKTNVSIPKSTVSDGHHKSTTKNGMKCTIKNLSNTNLGFKKIGIKFTKQKISANEKENLMITNNNTGNTSSTNNNNNTNNTNSTNNNTKKNNNGNNKQIETNHINIKINTNHINHMRNTNPTVTNNIKKKNNIMNNKINYINRVKASTINKSRNGSKSGAKYSDNNTSRNFQNKKNKILQIKTIKNFSKLYIFKLWRAFTIKNNNKSVGENIENFISMKVIRYFYKNGIIRKINKIRSLEGKVNLLLTKENEICIDEKKDTILVKYHKICIDVVKNLLFETKIQGIKSMSLYIYEYLVHILHENMQKMKFILKYYYDSDKRSIIKKPSITVIKDVLSKIIKVIEKPNIKNKASQEFIIYMKKIINFLNSNKEQVRPIIFQYLEIIKANYNMELNNIKSDFEYGNILNDFSSLRVLNSDNRINTNNIINNNIIENINNNGNSSYINEEIKLNLLDCQNNLIKSLINIDDDYDILLYKLQPIKAKIQKIEKQMENNKISFYTKYDDLKENKLIVQNIISEISKNIISKYDNIKYNGKILDIKLSLQYIEYLLIRYDILYDEINEGINILMKNNQSLLSSQFQKLYSNCIKVINKEKNINFDSVHFIILYDKLQVSMKNIEINDNANTNINEIKSENELIYIHKAFIYKEELEYLYKKIINNKNLSIDNATNQNIHNVYRQFQKYNEFLNKKKKLFIESIKKNDKNTNFNNLQDMSLEKTYIKLISQYVKYNNNENNSKNNSIHENISFIEKALFKQISQNQNSSESNENENTSNISIKNNFINNNLLLNINDYCEDYSNKEILAKIKEEIKSKNINYTNKQSLKEPIFPYPKIYFLDNEKRKKLIKSTKLTINDIIENYTLINPNKKLEINLFHNNKNLITGIKIFSADKKNSEFFKFVAPIPLPNLNKKSKNSFISICSIYHSIDKEISASLTKHLIESLGSFSENSFHNWVNLTFNQISICTLCLIFTNEINNLLSKKENKNKSPIREYKLINQKFSQWLNEECPFINCIINKVTIILTILSQMAIIEALIKNDVNDINSFNWLKYIRHSWDKKKEVIIECGGWANFQMKQLISYKPRILLSPDTDKIFLFNSSCFREKSASIIKIINNKYQNNSYSEIFEEYCNLFWTNMICVNSYIQKEEEMKKILDICTVDRCWIYIENLDLYNNNSQNNINNMIYFSKYIQTIQQEVILNDIKFNDGEKTFCIMGCISVDDEIKNKCEYLKGSSRIMNFIKPDIEFYLRTSINLYKNIDNNKDIKKYVELLTKNEKIIRDKLNGFYYDYDFYGEFLLYIIENNYIKSLNQISDKGTKIINEDNNSNNNINYNDDFFNKFLEIYSNKFLFISDNKNNLDEKMLEIYFDKNQIIYDEERIKLCKYLFLYSSDKLIKRTIILKGYGKHFIIKAFQNFYYEQKGKIFNEYHNINIIYDNESKIKPINIKNDIVNKTFTLPFPKKKMLLKQFCSNINQKLKTMNINIPDDFNLTLIEYIHQFIKTNSNNVIYYQSLILFNNSLNMFLEYIHNKKKLIMNNDNNNISLIFNIVTHCLLLSLGHEKNRIHSLVTIINNIIQPQIGKNLLQIINKNEYFYFDININIYKTFSNVNDYLKSLAAYIRDIFKTDGNCNNKNYYYFIFSECFANTKTDIDSCFNNKKEYIITDDIKNLLIDIESKYCKFFIGYDKSYTDYNNKINYINSNHYIKEITKNNNKTFSEKFSYLLSFFDFNELSIDEIKYLKNTLEEKAKEKLDINKIQNPLFIIETIYKAFSKANYYINLDKNSLLIHILKNNILKDTNIYINENKIVTSSNNIFLDLSPNEIKIKLIQQILSILLTKIKISKNIMMMDTQADKKNMNNNKHNDIINTILINELNNKDLFELSKMVNDIYDLESEDLFKEKYPNNDYQFSILKKLFYILNIKVTNIKENINDSYYNTKLLIQYLKYGNTKENKLKYHCLLFLNDILKNNNSKLKDISLLINNTLTLYKNLISNDDEYINSKYFYFSNIYNSSLHNQNIYNSLLEKIFLSLSNHFLFSLLLTFEIMMNNFEMSMFEKKYVINYLKNYYIFPSNNTIKFKYENEQDNFKTSFIKENGINLINFYTKVSKSIDNKYLNLLNSSLNTNNNKYFYTTSIRKINRDVDKLLYYITFVPDQSSSIFKYIINKYLLKIFNFGKFNINAALRKPNNKDNYFPITVKAFSSINIINFLCSLSAFFEIEFYIVRDGNIYNSSKKGNIDYAFKYLIDTNLIQLIKDGIKKGYWILICEKIDSVKFTKIIWELVNEIYNNKHNSTNTNNNENNTNNNSNTVIVHDNFKIFFDEKLILNDCKKAIEDMTTIVNIDNENVDDLEAAHDIWVNVLEERLLSESAMNETQKDLLEINDNGTSTEKSNVLNATISNNCDNRTNVINKSNNSIVSIKSIYNNSSLHDSKKTNAINNNNISNQNDLGELLNWTFLNKI